MLNPSPVLRLRVLATTDLHLHLMAYDYHNDRADDAVGLVRTATLIRQARSEAEAQGVTVVLLDNGDLLEGTPMADVLAQSQVPHPLITAMHDLGYDAATLGNHDFDFGLDYLDRVLAQARFPVLSSNAKRLHGRAWPDHALLLRNINDQNGQAHFIRIGLIGLLPPQVMQWNRQILAGQVTVRDIVATGIEKARALRRGGADLVIALAHTGIADPRDGPNPENAALDLARTGEIDALIAGHTHLHLPGPDHAGWPEVDPENARLGTVPALMPGARGAVLGVMDLTLQQTETGWFVAQHSSALRPIALQTASGQTRAVVADDVRLSRLFAPYHARALTQMRAHVRQTDAKLHSYFAALFPSDALALVARAQARTVRLALDGTDSGRLPLLSAVAPFKTGGRAGPLNYTDIPKGPLLQRHVADLYVFPNRLSAIRISGAILADWLEMSALFFCTHDPDLRTPQPLLIRDYPMYNFDVIYGLSYEIDLRGPARFSPDGRLRDPVAQRIRNLRWNGAAVAADQPFVVAVNTYRAGGGGHFPGLAAAPVVYDSDTTVVDCILQDLNTPAPYAPPWPDPWQLCPLGGAQVSFETGPGAMAHLDDIAGYNPVPMGVNDRGFLKLHLTL
ncbi:bifunctional 2',3'-cyclic-nucleotide 2'-phosphodiesterase/3'-nucleotidase [Sulfitobacter sp. JL08]|uniref:bifunctional 2',3'-cyclic-nucleotide 2'-phosphodiesterase/3'-nucleotidase n=1 Tax=Sulfitobacter sp. JL08 TaxID=2070369 RepID=UPI000E0B6963|nr:bifunctional 2',3'-cyclic-nucleotide 2'-phosphodiesterase/3'-nucleotidase [Sulfitobacter sp. JL08]AXI53295.1 bifunctional 2',3'-cyclic-nucleotide 2'-phosphodiesterase/3'-nucleotidase [Sulfitobacter sp. JL08]